MPQTKRKLLRGESYKAPFDRNVSVLPPAIYDLIRLDIFFNSGSYRQTCSLLTSTEIT